jgi:hypothetical protein
MNLTRDCWILCLCFVSFLAPSICPSGPPGNESIMRDVLEEFDELVRGSAWPSVGLMVVVLASIRGSYNREFYPFVQVLASAQC